jgi:hypothetical protein
MAVISLNSYRCNVPTVTTAGDLMSADYTAHYFIRECAALLCCRQTWSSAQRVLEGERIKHQQTGQGEVPLFSIKQKNNDSLVRIAC